MFIHGGTPSFRYRPAIDKRFIMPCTYWIRDMDRFKVFRLEYDGLNKLQNFITTKLPIGRTHDGKYGSMINDPLSNILDMKHNHNPDLPNLGDKRINNYMHLYNKKSIDIINNLKDSCMDVFAVNGNNDDYPDLSKIETIHTQFGDIVIEHGDKHAVDYHNSLRASHPDALFIIYGHTHKHICDMKNKPYVLNPGAAGKTRTQGGASCGLINIDTSGNISVEIKKYTK